MEKSINYTENDRAIVAALKGNEPMSLAEISEATGLNLVPGHIVAAMRKGLIAKAGEREVEKMGTRAVCSYEFVTADALKNAEGKEFNYTDSEKEILAAASEMESPFTLAKLSEVMGRKITSGSTNGLIRKGNIAKGEKVDVETTVKTIVSTYQFVRDIDAE